MSNLKLKTKNLELRRGFTLIELMVAMGLFVLLIGIVVNIFITSLQRQRSVVALMVANDNASLAIEQMAREVRTGSGFSVNQATGALQFTNARGETVEYRYDATAKEIERSVAGANEANALPITGNNVSVSDLRFTIVNLGISWPPRIVINVQIKFTDRFLKTAVNDFQTTVSVREI